jgi:hypothetical protein
MNEEIGTFGVQKKIIIPMGWIFLIEILPDSDLREIKMVGRIKNKSVI